VRTPVIVRNALLRFGPARYRFPKCNDGQRLQPMVDGQSKESGLSVGETAPAAVE